ncbi:MAG: D-alanine--D-alanine ligase family protein [Myxococcota bacterium]
MVLRGGQSGEHDISLVTAQAVIEALRVLGHEAFPVTLGRNGGADWPEGTGRVTEALDAAMLWGTDVAFIAMHGAFGEDGRIQGTLESLGIPYQGSGVAASAVAMDKGRAKVVYRAEGLPVAGDTVLLPRDLGRIDWHTVGRQVGMPCVLKTAESGSSVGVEVVESLEELAQRGPALLATSTSLLVESWLPGREFTVAVLEGEDGEPHPMPVVEIVPHGDRWFDYDTKYDPSVVDELCPAPIDVPLTEALQALGVTAHLALGCRDYSRTDFKLNAEGQPVLLETNTLPGLTPASLMPKAAAASGLAFDALIEALVLRAATRRC